MISLGYFRDPERGGGETEQPMLFSTGGFKPPTLEKKHSADIRGQTAVKTFAKIIYTSEERKDQRSQRGIFYQTKDLTHLLLAIAFLLLISGQNRLFDDASTFQSIVYLKILFSSKKEGNETRTLKGLINQI